MSMVIEFTVTKRYNAGSFMDESSYGVDVVRSITSPEYAALWCLDMFVRNHDRYGADFVIHHVDSDLVDASSTSLRLPMDVPPSGVINRDMSGATGWSYDFRGAPEALFILKGMVLVGLRSVAPDHPKLVDGLINKVAAEMMNRELASA